MPVKINVDRTDSYVASAALTGNRLVKLHTTAGQIAHAGVGDQAFGSIQEDVASGATATVFRARGAHLLTASAAITAGDYVKVAANGKVAPETTPTTPTALSVGQAKDAAAGDGSLLTVELF